ncbi:MAG TPA: EamA family transporter [Burkholderiales bacterium]|nr:EamA family transporter [Burkholderiales bacterium]
MSPGVGYALLSLLAAGVLDVVFARYSGKRPVSGAYLFVIGGVVIAGQSAVLAIARVPFAWDASTAAWGLTAGAVLLLANALLVESLARINVSLGSTIYRLNTIAVLLFAVVFLHETLTFAKTAGVLLGVIAVVMLYQRGGRGDTDRLVFASLWIAIAASLLRAAFGIISKTGLLDGTDPFLFLVYVGVGWTVAAIAYGFVRRRPPGSTSAVLRYGIVCGTLVCLVASFLLLGLRSGEASVVIPIANMSFVVALLTSAALGMERITRHKVFAVGCAAVAIGLLTSA